MTYLNDKTYLTVAKYIRYICGTCYILNGVHWFIKILPFPSMSDPVMPMTSNMTADFLGAMVGSGWIFTSVKTIELLTGICLVLDIFVPLMLTVSMSIVAMTFFVNFDFFHIDGSHLASAHHQRSLFWRHPACDAGLPDGLVFQRDRPGRRGCAPSRPPRGRSWPRRQAPPRAPLRGCAACSGYGPAMS